jgi:TolB-like protein/DNA-binding winged helix-turn-helix (wHTH) protein/tetratricopeptide (TPR) repeat protein
MNGDLRVGTWLVQPGLNTISHNGTSRQLEPRVMEVLVCLAHHPGETLPKEQLLRTVWPDTFVSDDVLVRSISEIRRAFEDDPRESKFIQTISKRGYRLLAPVVLVNGNTRLAAEVSKSADTAKQSIFSRRGLRIGIVIGVTSTVALLALLALMPADVWRKLAGKGEVPQIRSLAVLPLQNLSGDPAQEYFADAMTEELITELSRISALKVISRTSVMRYKKTDRPLPEIARQLGVDGIVAGSVLRSGERVRITAQLIYAPGDTNLWAQTYDRDLRDVLILQSAVAGAIADEIRVKMTPGEKVRMADSHPVNPAALEAYLKGEYHSDTSRFGKDARFKAAEYFEQATRIDPKFARAYVALAWAHIPNVAPTPEEVPVVTDALEKALALDPNLADAHHALARFKEFHDWDFPGAEREFQRAIELDPSDAMFHDQYGDYLDNMGRYQEGEREEQLAQQLDPGSDHLMDGYNHRGEYGRVLEISRNQVEAHPDDVLAHDCLAMACLRTGRYKEAIEELQRVVVLSGYAEMARPLAKAYAASGYQGALRLWAKDLEQAQGNPASPTMVAEVYTYLGDKENAFKWLEKAYSERDGFLVGLGGAGWQPLRSDPRFQDLVRRVGLPQ